MALSYDDVLDAHETSESEFALAWEGVIIEVLSPLVGLPKTWEHFLLQP